MMTDLAAGIRYVVLGQRWLAQHPGRYGRALLPALIAVVLYAAALLVLLLNAGALAAWITPFADDWDSPWRGLVRGLAVALLLAAGFSLTVLTFTAVTLVIGDPFYDALSAAVEESEGDCPAGPERPLWRELWAAAVEALYVLWRATLWTVPLFVLGFLPVIGQTVIPVIAFAVSGFFLTLELVCYALGRRGIEVKERLRLLRGRRWLAVGFGVPLVAAFLVPVAAIFLMPGAVAGATLLARDLMGAGTAPGAGPEPGPAPGPDLTKPAPARP
ncbi:EI24 domain-containing protein [Streptomyces carpaticus]|uniref:EI24 domain-containing protein n=1 Tax=Streptomyces carpaticus TaxID=285558 RepID=A0ABV4ZMD7_9ACTN